MHKQALLFLLLFFSGCAPYKVPTPSIPTKAKSAVTSARKHPLYQIIPRHRAQIRWYDLPHWLTWALFGNDDDGIFGEEPSAHYLPCKKPNSGKALRWFLRNPLHNFTFYVIGSADKKNSELELLRLSCHECSSGTYRPLAKTNFPSKCCSCFYLAFHGGKPFLSMRLIHSKTRKSDFYIGWRNRGNFGIKCVLFGKRKKQTRKELNSLL